MNADSMPEVHIRQWLGLIEVSPTRFDQPPGEVGGLARAEALAPHRACPLAGVNTDRPRATDKNVGNPGVIDIVRQHPQISSQRRGKTLMQLCPERG